jgi:hypothetical protein
VHPVLPELPMLILVQKMLRWLIPHLPIQASTLAVKSKTVVVDILGIAHFY